MKQIKYETTHENRLSSEIFTDTMATKRLFVEIWLSKSSDFSLIDALSQIKLNQRHYAWYGCGLFYPLAFQI